LKLHVHTPPHREKRGETRENLPSRIWERAVVIKRGVSDKSPNAASRELVESGASPKDNPPAKSPP